MMLKQSTRTDEAYQYIHQKIIEGEITLGSRLHITNLAEETGFSNTPIRESLARLEMYGLAESFPHKGVYVVSPSEKDLQEMIEGRLCLEVFMAHTVIQNVTPKDIEIMRSACLKAASVLPSVRLSFEEGLHGYYANISGNKFLEHLYKRVMALLNVLYIQGLRSCEDENWINEHRRVHYEEEMDIIAALEANDLARLENAVKLHVKTFGVDLLTALKEWPPIGLNWSL